MKLIRVGAAVGAGGDGVTVGIGIVGEIGAGAEAVRASMVPATIVDMPDGAVPTAVAL